MFAETGSHYVIQAGADLNLLHRPRCPGIPSNPPTTASQMRGVQPLCQANRLAFEHLNARNKLNRNSTETLSGCFAFHKSTLLANILQSQFREELVPGPEPSERGKNCMLRAGLAPVIYSEDSEN